MAGDGGNREGSKGGGKKRSFPGDYGGGRKHVFKVLCPESLITSILGPRGATKDQIQEETGCKLIFSNRDEYFPGTRYRTLCIYANEPEAIVPVLERIVDRIIECSEQELQGPPPKGEADFLGREGGEYVLRGLISGKMSGAIIGPKGATVQAIRESNNAKVFIDKNHYSGHQLLRVIAPPDGLRSALVRINECMQTEVNADDFQQWAAIRSFSEEGGSQEKGGKSGTGKSSGKSGSKGSRRGDRRGSKPQRDEEGGGRDRERSPRREQSREGDHSWDPWDGDQAEWRQSGGGDKAAADPSPEQPSPGGAADGSPFDQETLQALLATARDFPGGTLEWDYTVTCALPVHKVPFLLGKDDENIESIRRSTGTQIHFEELPDAVEGQQTLVLQGPLLRIYRAHTLMMKSYHDSEREVANETPDVKKLQEQLAELQKQLELVQAQMPGTTGGGKGKGKRS